LFDGITLHSRRKSLKDLSIHLDNASQHNERLPTDYLHTKKIQRRPNLAPYDFFRYGYIKRKLTEYHIPDRQSLKSALTHISAEIGQETQIAVFETCINRLELVIEHEGEYFHPSMKKENA
jgi:hypothetical protein